MHVNFSLNSLSARFYRINGGTTPDQYGYRLVCNGGTTCQTNQQDQQRQPPGTSNQSGLPPSPCAMNDDIHPLTDLSGLNLNQGPTHGMLYKILNAERPFV